MRNVVMIVISSVILGLAACGGGSAGSGSSVSAATITYPSGAVLGTGPVDAQGRKQGAWTFFFEEGGMMWQATFTDGDFNAAAPWVEFNADGSIRYHHSDGAPLHQPPA